MTEEVRLVGVFGVALAGALLAVPTAIRVAGRFELFDEPQGWKIHVRRTPYLGGAAVLFGFTVALLAFGDGTGRFAPLLVGALVLSALGTVDDKYNLPATLRIAAVVGVALVLQVSGEGWSLFSSEVANFAVTALWTLGIVNALNLLDLMDGIAAGMAAVVAAGIAVFALILGDPTLAALALAVAGGCLGFLRYNLRSPSAIFLGDGGSMAIGVILAGAVMALPLEHEVGGDAIVAGILLVGVPILDMTFRVYSRIRRGVSLMTAGPDSVVNFLRQRLQSPRAVTIALGAAQALLASLAIIATESGGDAVAALGACAFVSGVALIVLLDRSGFGRDVGIQASGDLAKTHASIDGQVPVVHMIARLNVGGATTQAIALAGLLRPKYRTMLVRGVEESREGTMDSFAEALGVDPLRVPSLRRKLGPHDLRALVAVTRIIRRERPLVLHTHTAKAGMIGRLAAILAGRHRPPIVLHMFHGHVLDGYFSPVKSRFFALLERGLARRTTRLLVVSEQVRDDLVRLKVAPREKMEVIELGLGFSDYGIGQEEQHRLRSGVRAELGIPAEAPVVSLISRVVPIKRIDRFLRIAALLAEKLPSVRFLIVGDGELRPGLEASADARALGQRLVWAGFRDDVPAVCFASDVVALTSDNEGTPVSLIEAQAAGRPVVSTRAGGASAAVIDGVTGLLVDPADEVGFAAALERLLTDAAFARRLGTQGRDHAHAKFSLDRLIADMDALYQRLLAGVEDPAWATSSAEPKGTPTGQGPAGVSFEG